VSRVYEWRTSVDFPTGTAWHVHGTGGERLLVVVLGERRSFVIVDPRPWSVMQPDRECGKRKPRSTLGSDRVPLAKHHPRRRAPTWTFPCVLSSDEPSSPRAVGLLERPLSARRAGARRWHVNPDLGRLINPRPRDIATSLENLNARKSNLAVESCVRELNFAWWRTPSAGFVADTSSSSSWRMLKHNMKSGAASSLVESGGITTCCSTFRCKTARAP
jgi:hypothetical protein